LPLDGHHLIETGKVSPLCANTWHMLDQTRFAPDIDFVGNFDKYYGILKAVAYADAAEASCC
jgi:arsenite methyltransferase